MMRCRNQPDVGVRRLLGVLLAPSPARPASAVTEAPRRPASEIGFQPRESRFRCLGGVEIEVGLSDKTCALLVTLILVTFSRGRCQCLQQMNWDSIGEPQTW